MITNSGLLPMEAGDFYSSAELYGIQEGSWALKLLSRFLLREYAMIYALGWGLLILLFIFKQIVLDTLYYILCNICCSNKMAKVSASEAKEAEEDFSFSDDFFKDLKIKSLKDLHCKTENEIQDFEKLNDIKMETTK
jgi:hypothetical protein